MASKPSESEPDANAQIAELVRRTITEEIETQQAVPEIVALEPAKEIKLEKPVAVKEIIEPGIISPALPEALEILQPQTQDTETYLEVTFDDPVAEIIPEDFTLPELIDYEVSKTAEDMFFATDNETFDEEELMVADAGIEIETSETKLPELEDALVLEPNEVWLPTSEVILPKALEDHLQTLEPETAEAVRVTIDDLVEAVQQLSRQQETNEEIASAVEQQIEELYIQLLESLGIDYDDEIIKHFMETIKAIDPDKTENIPEIIWEEGTHEQKLDHSSLLTTLLNMIHQQIPAFHLLGKLALRLGLTRLDYQTEQAHN